jgi:hypothetical protein
VHGGFAGRSEVTANPSKKRLFSFRFRFLLANFSTPAETVCPCGRLFLTMSNQVKQPSSKKKNGDIEAMTRRFRSRSPSGPMLAL